MAMWLFSKRSLISRVALISPLEVVVEDDELSKSKFHAVGKDGERDDESTG